MQGMSPLFVPHKTEIVEVSMKEKTISKKQKAYIYDEILRRVEKPGRYSGGEWNSIIKNPDDMNIRYGFCFPDVYEVGMSHLGSRILYHLLNDQEDIYCERVFAPWPDMEKELRKEGIPLFSQESRDSIRDFDFLGFTLQYELSYSNILNMLDMAGIPIKSEDRGDGMPFIMAGGPCAYNPEPLYKFVDMFLMGEGEELMLDVMEAYRKWKISGESRERYLEAVSQIDGVYVPKFYDVQYNEDGTVKSIEPNFEKAPKKIRKRIVRDLNEAYFPDKIIVPFIDIVHDRAVLEIFRGCTRGCRFCQAGMIYRPVRERSVEKLLEIADKLLASSGYEEVSISSLSTSDYPELFSLVQQLISRYKEDQVNMSLPSLRIDSFSMKIVQEIQKVRKSGLTFAPEAGSQRMRDVINKGVDEQDLMDSVGAAFECGYTGLKLYFMIGLPTETMEDVLGIGDLAKKVVERYYQVPKDVRGKGLSISVSASSFVPKPFTPFQWVPQDSIQTLREKQVQLRDLLRPNKQIQFSWHESKTSYVEAIFARGDRKVADALEEAWKNGAKFDGWDEHFRFDVWMAAFEKLGMSTDFYAARTRSLEEYLPWDHIDVGVTKEYLKSEYELSIKGELTQDCRKGCTGCGMNVLEGGVC